VTYDNEQARRLHGDKDSRVITAEDGYFFLPPALTKCILDNEQVCVCVCVCVCVAECGCGRGCPSVCLSVCQSVCLNVAVAMAMGWLWLVGSIKL